MRLQSLDIPTFADGLVISFPAPPPAAERVGAFSVQIDPHMPPNIIELRDPCTGRTLATAINLGALAAPQPQENPTP